MGSGCICSGPISGSLLAAARAGEVVADEPVLDAEADDLVAFLPVEDADQIMLVTDKSQLIRSPVEGIRIAGRSTQA